MVEKLEVRQALDRGLGLPCALIRSLSRVTLGPTPEDVDLPELIEARFFSPDEEVRIFQGETGLQAARLWENSGDAVIERTDKPADTALFGRSMTVRQLLDFDEDGQAFVVYTRLAGWEGGN